MLVFEPYGASEPTRGSFLKVVVLLYLCALEDALKNGNSVLVNIMCVRLEKLVKYNLSITECSRDKSMTVYVQTQILAINSYIISTFYQLAFSDYPENLKTLVHQSIRSIMIYLISLIDILNTRSGGAFTKYESVFKKQSERGSSPNLTVTTFENDTLFTLLTFELFKCVLGAGLPQPLMTIPEIRQHKLNQFSNIDSAILSKDWFYATTENYAVQELIRNFFGESYIKINNNIFSNLQVTASKLESVIEIFLDKIASTARSWEDLVYEKAAKIHEAEDVRRHEIIALDDENMRIAKRLWRKVWKRMRTFAGQWRHPDFWDQQDEKYRALDWKEIKKNPLFYHKMSRFETTSRARPFLKLKLIEPDYALKYEAELREKRQRKQLVSVNTDILPTLNVQNLYIPVEKASTVSPNKELARSFSFKKGFLKVAYYFHLSIN